MKFRTVYGADPAAVSEIVNELLAKGWTIHSTAASGGDRVAVAWVFLVLYEDDEIGEWF